MLATAGFTGCSGHSTKIAIAGDTASAIVHRVGNSDDFAAVVRGVIEADKADH